MMRVSHLMRATATLLCCLASVGVAQVRGGRAAATAAQMMVPSVIGLSLNDAIKVMSDAHFRCTATSVTKASISPGDIVENQKPPAKTQVPFTTTCTLFVRPQTVQRTPNVLGLSMRSADSILRVAELKRRVTYAPSPDTALGSVLQQNPLPGAPISADRSIDLTIAGVPQLVRRSLADARASIERAHLRLGSTTDTVVSAGADDTVLKQSPPAGQAVKPQTPVDLVVARVRATVPSIVGQSLDRATTTLTDARLVRGRIDSLDSPRSANEVLRQAIPAQAIVPLGTRVNVTVSRHTFRMPNLVGQTIADARATVVKENLTIGGLKISNADGRPGVVVDQLPVAGAPVHDSDSVTLFGPRVVAPKPVDVASVPPKPNPAPAHNQPATPAAVSTPAPNAPVKPPANPAATPPANPAGNPSANPVAVPPGSPAANPPAKPAAVPSGNRAANPPANPTPVPAASPPPFPGGGASSILVPDFTGHRIDRALNLPGVGSLRVVTRFAPPSRVARDSIVIAQSIPPRTRVAAGTEVVLTVSQRESVRMLRLTIVPESISVHPGDTVRLTAIAHMSDSTQTRVLATWTASSGNIERDGRFIAGASMSRVVVTASQGGQTETAVILVDTSRVDTSRPWWPIVLIAAGLAGLSVIGRLAWRFFHPLAFTYDYKLPAPVTEIAASGGPGLDLALVSYAGESEQTIAPRGVKLFDEEKSYG